MDDGVRFAADLFRGTAGHYDRYRLPYPEAMLTDLVRRAGVSGRGRLLDLACGTGQLAFPLRHWFRQVWAVDQEPDMVEVVRAKAAAQGAGDVRPIVSDAETLDAEPGYFELAVIGNAFSPAQPRSGRWPDPRMAPDWAGAWRCAGLPSHGKVSRIGNERSRPPWTGGRRPSVPSTEFLRAGTCRRSIGPI